MDRFKSSDYVQMLYEVCPEAKTAQPGKIHSEKLPFLRTVVMIRGEKQPGMWSWDEVLKMGDEVPDEILQEGGDGLDFDDPINIQIHFGHNRFPEGCGSHAPQHLEQWILYRRMHEVHRKRPAMHTCSFLSLLRHGALQLACVTHGAAMVLPAEHFDPVSVMSAIEKERCTAVHGVPTMFVAELEHPDFPKYDFST